MSKDMNDMDGLPPLSPIGEQSVPDDPAFAKACIANLKLLKKLGRIAPGPYVLTRAAPWGLIFRADFTIDGQSYPDAVDRFVCYKDEKGRLTSLVAIGQRIPALKSSNQPTQ